MAISSAVSLSLPCVGTTARSVLYAAGASSWNGPITLNGDGTASPGDQITFAGAISGAPFADLLLGYPTLSLLGTNDNAQKLRTWSFNTFVQDDWRLSSRLTVNMGLRYEFNAPPVDSS